MAVMCLLCYRIPIGVTGLLWLAGTMAVLGMLPQFKFVSCSQNV